MSKIEDPIQFDIKKKIGNIEMTYFNLMEISQGGPEVGSLSINGKIVEGYYGGPAICQEEYVYVPTYIKKFLRTGFKLARINIDTLEVEHFGKTKDLIFIDRIEGNRVYFFEDMSKTIRRHYEFGR